VDRVRVIPHRGRKFDEGSFRSVASAVLERRQLAFEYRARSTDEPTKRTVSPQRLTHYRDNWYLDAWDHDREPCAASPWTASTRRGWSTAPPATSPTASWTSSWAPATASSPVRRRAGRPSCSAPRPRAGWPTSIGTKQQGRFLADGRYELKVPYSVSRELLMDVLHYGSDAEIVEPVMLREQAKALLELALSNYEKS
jgi:predicted DNA-binding transcriptional regulator YafY